jgi:glutaminyl-peptide cyclotransferase
MALPSLRAMTDKSIRPLAVMLFAQLVLVAALLFWAGIGFPLPAAITGGPERTKTAPPAPLQPTGGAPADDPVAASAAARDALLAPRPTADRFDAPRAFALLREQVLVYGWRPAGSPALRRLAARLRPLLPNGRYEDVPGHPGLRNVVGSLPGHGKAIVIGAHYDVESHPAGFVGANDGAAGSAAVVWLARALARAPRSSADRPLRFVLFDGEEEPPDCLADADFPKCALRGSKAYVKRHGDDVQRLVLLDYIAEKHGLSFPYEATSNRRMWDRLRTAARDVGVGRLFPDAVGPGIIDDHTPFLQRGIPAIDVIDFHYPPADTLADRLDKVSQRSLDAVGETVYLLATRLRRSA